jgi:hypothetical protein|nr:hypothetical protein [Bacillota bacterium]
MALTFELTDRQVQKAEKWLEEHDCPAKKFMEATGSSPALGERVRFIFIPTMLGTIPVVECSCKAYEFLIGWDDL